MATQLLKSKAVKRRLAIFFMVFDLRIYPIRWINVKFVTKKNPPIGLRDLSLQETSLLLPDDVGGARRC